MPAARPLLAAWNEPNLSYYLAPQWTRAGGRWVAASPVIYRGLLNADDVAVPDVYKLARVLHAAVRDGHVRPAGPKRLWVTELSWDSSPRGLFYLGGVAKPAAQAFRFPFVTRRLSRGRIQAWGRAPRGGRIAIEQQRGSRWVVLRRLAMRSDQVFDVVLSVRGRATLRAQADPVTSLAWTQRR